MIALHTSNSDLRWAKDNSTGDHTKFEGIICRPSIAGSGAAGTATFTGDTDGSDNWEYITSIDPAGAADAATNYPAFNWVNEYNTTYASKLGGKTFDWYMPNLVELCEVYNTLEVPECAGTHTLEQCRPWRCWSGYLHVHRPTTSFACAKLASAITTAIRGGSEMSFELYQSDIYRQDW